MFFQDYHNVLNPRSLLDIVDKSVLQSHMRSFFYGQHTGLTLVYDESRDSLLQQFDNVDPFDDEAGKGLNHHPFCAEFRKDFDCDKKCRGCDLEHARKLFENHGTDLVEYKCHMGLMDLNYPIRLNNRVRGVLFAGQRVPEWEPDGKSRLRTNVLLQSPSRESVLLPLLDQRPYFSDMPPKDEYDRLKSEFKLFGSMVQTLVDTLYKAKQQEAIHKATIEVSEKLGVSHIDPKNGWWNTTDDILNELEVLLGGNPLVLLVRKKSQYVVCAASAAGKSVRETTIPLTSLFAELPSNQWTHYQSSQPEYQAVFDVLSKQLKPTSERLRSDSTRGTSMALYPYRRTGPQQPALSTVLVAIGNVRTHEDLLDDICRVMAFHSHVGVLLERMELQRQQFIREVRFTAHSLKTPIQTAMLELKPLKDYANGRHKLPPDEAGELAEELEELLYQSVLDSQMLQIVGREFHKEFDVVGLFKSLLPRFATLGAKRGVTLQVESGDDKPIIISAVESQIRVAFSNLLDNAVKYSFNHREVRIRIRKIAQEVVTFEFENYGVGIDAQRRQELFQPGGRASLKDSRRDRPGAGLGLVQAKEFIDGCDGLIEIDSKQLFPWTTTSSNAIITVNVTLPIK